MDQYKRAVTITPSDSADLTHRFKGFIVGEGGTAHIDTQNHTGSCGDGLDMKLNLTAGVVYPIAISRFRDTGTSAGSIVGLI